MDRHRLRIGQMHTRVHASIGSAESWAEQLDNAMRHQIPRAMGRAIDERFNGRDGVIRVDRIQLHLKLDGPMNVGALAEMFAKRLVARLLEAPALTTAQMRAKGVCYWPSRAAYAADYVRHALGLIHGPEWAFADFAPLRHLPRTQAAVETLVAGGAAVLAELSTDGTRQLPGLAPPQIDRLLGALSADEVGSSGPVARGAPGGHGERKQGDDTAGARA